MSGDYVPIAAQGDLLLYRRQHEGATVVIALNLGRSPFRLRQMPRALTVKFCFQRSSTARREDPGRIGFTRNEGAIIGASLGT